MAYNQVNQGNTTDGNLTVNTLTTEQYVADGWGKVGRQHDEHDHSSGKGLAVKRIQSGLDAAKPTGGTSAGTLYVATDTGVVYFDDGTDLDALGTLDNAQTWTALQTLTGGFDASGASAGVNKILDLTFTDETAPAAPGAGKTILYAVSGVLRYRAGAAGADSPVGITTQNATATLGVDQALTQNTYTDVASVTVPASGTGTYWVQVSTTCVDTGAAAAFSLRAYDSTTSTNLCSDGATSAGASSVVNLAASKIIALTAGDTIKLQATSNGAASTAKATLATNGAGATATNINIVRVS